MPAVWRLFAEGDLVALPFTLFLHDNAVRSIVDQCSCHDPYGRTGGKPRHLCSAGNKLSGDRQGPGSGLGQFLPVERVAIHGRIGEIRQVENAQDGSRTNPADSIIQIHCLDACNRPGRRYRLLRSDIDANNPSPLYGWTLRNGWASRFGIDGHDDLLKRSGPPRLPAAGLIAGTQADRYSFDLKDVFFDRGVTLAILRILPKVCL